MGCLKLTYYDEGMRLRPVTLNNPVRYIDPDGREPGDAGLKYPPHLWSLEEGDDGNAYFVCRQEGTRVLAEIDDVLDYLRALYDGASSEGEGGESVSSFVISFLLGTTDFAKNYYLMRRANTINADKYYHARANYEATVRGQGGELAALLISITREVTDYLRGDSFAACMEDVRANRYGRHLGRLNRGSGRSFEDVVPEWHSLLFQQH